MKKYFTGRSTLFFIALLFSTALAKAQFAACGMKAFNLSGPANITSNSVDLNWTSAAATSSAGPFYQIVGGTISPPTTTFLNGTATSLSPGTSYTFHIAAVKYCGSGNEQEQDLSSNSITVLTRPAPPTGLSASNISSNSFTASWNGSPSATSYTLEVADNSGFTGASPYTTTSTTYNVNGLLPGTAYYFRVTASNATGAGFAAASASVTTQLVVPSITAATAITTGGFTANWNAVQNATGYQLDVSTNSNFSNYLSGFQNVSVAASAGSVSKAVTGCSPGTLYYYRVRAVNSLTVSGNATSSVPTVPPAPVAAAASSIATTQLTANWSAAPTAISYKIDVSADPLFSQNLAGYDGATVSATQVVVSGLDPSTFYYYRVRAVNASGISAYSQNITTLTIAVPPADISVLTKAKELDASWLAIPHALQYQLFVSRNQGFTDMVTGYDPKTIDASVNADVISGLAVTTVYYLRLRVVNQTGTSDFSNIKVAQTTSETAPTPITIAAKSIPANHLPATSSTIAVTITGGQGSLTVKLYHRANSTTDYVLEQVTADADTYSITAQDSWFDMFGMQYYFEVTDQAGTVKRSAEPANPQQINSAVQTTKVPLSHFGKDISNYRIISVPYATSKTKIQDLFETILGAYNKSQWRLLEYYNEKTNDYLDGVSVSDLTQGKSYWFISKEPVDLSFGQGTTNGNSVSQPFVMSLKKGWTQIGNPFPYTLSWADILASNSNPSGVGNLIGFDPATISLTENDTLKVYGGGFVFAENDIDIIIPVTTPAFGGRRGSSSKSGKSNNYNDWVLSITVSQKGVTNISGGIGMNVIAMSGKDAHDKVTPPRFLRYLEFSSSLPGFDYTVDRSVVAVQNDFTWEYSIASDEAGEVEMVWDKSIAAALDGQLILHDLTNNLLLNMAAVTRYSAQPQSKFRIYYNKRRSFIEETVQLNVPYPNPFSASVSIPFDYNNLFSDDASAATITIMNAQGQLVKEMKNNGTGQDALQHIEWDGLDFHGNAVAKGIYLYRISISKSDKAAVLTGRIIRE